MINVAKRLCLKHRNHSKLLYKQLPSHSLQNRYSENRQKSCIEYIVNKTHPKFIATTSCLPRFDSAYSNFRRHDSSHFNYISKRLSSKYFTILCVRAVMLTVEHSIVNFNS